MADLDESLAHAEKLGGRRIVERTPIGSVGAFAMIADPDGTMVGLFEETPRPTRPDGSIGSTGAPTVPVLRDLGPCRGAPVRRTVTGRTRPEEVTMAVENVPAEHTPDEHAPNEPDDLRARATQRLRKRADFRTHLLIYVLVNAFLILIWWIVGSPLFWPIFPLVGWGIGLGANAWDVYRPDPTSEEKIQREIDRMRP